MEDMMTEVHLQGHISSRLEWVFCFEHMYVSNMLADSVCMADVTVIHGTNTPQTLPTDTVLRTMRYQSGNRGFTLQLYGGHKETLEIFPVLVNEIQLHS